MKIYFRSQDFTWVVKYTIQDRKKGRIWFLEVKNVRERKDEGGRVMGRKGREGQEGGGKVNEGGEDNGR